HSHHDVGLPVQRVDTIEALRNTAIGNTAGLALERTTRTLIWNQQGITPEASSRFQAIDLHTLPADKVLAQLGSISAEKGGLVSVDAASRLKKNGLNTITPPRDNYFFKVMSFLFGGFCFLMWCAAGIIFLSYYPLPQLDALLASEARVIRDGKTISIPASEVLLVIFVPILLHGVQECRFMGTMVVNGSAKAVVAFTGETLLWVNCRSSGKKKSERTLLQKEVDNFVVFVAPSPDLWFTCMLVWGFYLNKQPVFSILLLECLETCGYYCRFRPEGLPIAVSVSLTLIARRMAKQFVLVKNLTTIETLGAVTIICTDKTGTLTQNKMTLRDTDVSAKAKGMFHTIAAQCCAAEFVDDESVHWLTEHSGDATDKAVLRFAEGLGSLYEIPFNSRNKWMMTIQRSLNKFDVFDGATTMFVKGAPDVIYPKITRIVNADGSISPFDDAAKAQTKDTVEKCKTAHIRVAMVTGDFALTAVSIAREVSIITTEKVDTNDILTMKYKVNKKGKKIYERAEPSEMEEAHRAIVILEICCYQELIVDEFKIREEVVAVTGDGVNDSPALRRQCSEVAMEAATLVLIDNNFSSLIAGIESGRLCFDNIKKVSFLLSIFIGIPMPLNTAMCLVICSPESTLMTRPPRNPKRDRLVNGQMFIHWFSRSMYFTYCQWYYVWSFDDGSCVFPNGYSNAGNSVYFVCLVFAKFWKM
ncbi:calcium ATPase, partial [Rhizoclosmatium globosum]